MRRSLAARLLALVLCTALLCGCNSVSSVEELLRAPQLSVDARAVQSALRSYLGETVQLRYPNQGDFLTPYFFGDWDGDGQTDAAVLYQASDSVNVQMALLSMQEGSWRVLSTVDGLSATVDSVRLARMQESGAEQILVGYATAGDAYLAVYTLREGALETVLQQVYSQYLVEDVTGDGEDDLVVLSEDDKGKTQVQVLIGDGDGFAQLPLIELSEKQFSGYASLAAGSGEQNGRFLVLDGWTGASGQALASAMFRYDAENQRMIMAKLAGTTNLYEDSVRYAPCLTSRDLDGDGVVEIPIQVEATGQLGVASGKRYSFVKWMDFTRRPSEKSFGLLDETYSLYLELPSSWEGNLLLVESVNDTLELYDLTGNVLRLRLRITDEPALNGWRTIGLAASHQVQAQLGAGVDNLTMADLRSGLYQM